MARLVIKERADPAFLGKSNKIGLNFGTVWSQKTICFFHKKKEKYFHNLTEEMKRIFTNGYKNFIIIS